MGGPIIIFEQKTYLESRPPPVLLIVFTFCVLPLVIQSVVTCQAVIKQASRSCQAVRQSGSNQAVVTICFSYLKNVLNLQCLPSLENIRLILLLKSYARQGLCYYSISEFQNMYHTWHPCILRFWLQLALLDFEATLKKRQQSQFQIQTQVLPSRVNWPNWSFVALPKLNRKYEKKWDLKKVFTEPKTTAVCSIFDRT